MDNCTIQCRQPILQEPLAVYLHRQSGKLSLLLADGMRMAVGEILCPLKRRDLSYCPEITVMECRDGMTTASYRVGLRVIEGEC